MFAHFSHGLKSHTGKQVFAIKALNVGTSECNNSLCTTKTAPGQHNLYNFDRSKYLMESNDRAATCMKMHAHHIYLNSTVFERRTLLVYKILLLMFKFVEKDMNIQFESI